MSKQFCGKGKNNETFTMFQGDNRFLQPTSCRSGWRNPGSGLFFALPSKVVTAEKEIDKPPPVGQSQVLPSERLVAIVSPVRLPSFVRGLVKGCDGDRRVQRCIYR
ncbi:MAG: hypothetical protein ACK5PS_05275 [Desulfopila sp.]